MAKLSCSIDGCGKPERTEYGAPLAFAKEAAASETDECIEWPYGKDTGGYGTLKIDGRNRLVHRWVLATVTGGDREGMDAAHTPGICHKRACVNPAHLRWATRAENAMDRVLDDTHHRGERHPRAKLTTEQVLEIRASTESQRALAARYNVSQQTIHHIVSRKRWAWLEHPEISL